MGRALEMFIELCLSISQKEKTPPKVKGEWRKLQDLACGAQTGAVN